MLIVNRWGVGADIADIERFRRWTFHDNRRFYERIFTQREIRQCMSSKDPAPHFAANFSAKEAVYKALSNTLNVRLNEIEILRDKLGAPRVNLLLDRNITAIQLRRRQNPHMEIKVSLSHSASHALAFAVVNCPSEP